MSERPATPTKGLECAECGRDELWLGGYDDGTWVAACPSCKIVVARMPSLEVLGK